MKAINMLNSSPTVSIGLPVYNGEMFLSEAIESILAQTYTDFELIIVDNASTDRTKAISEKYTRKDERVKYYRNRKNMGAAYNYNRTFELSTGEYFKWAAHDDIIAPEFVKECINVLKDNPKVVCSYPNTFIIDEKGEIIKRFMDAIDLSNIVPSKRFEMVLELYNKGSEANAIFGLIRTESLKKTNLIGNYVSSDINLLAELALMGELHKIQLFLFYRRDHKGTSLRNYPKFADRAVWFDPEKKGKIQFIGLIWVRGHIKSIQRVPMRLIDKIDCYYVLVKWIFSMRKFLIKNTIMGCIKILKNTIITLSNKLSNPKYGVLI